VVECNSDIGLINHNSSDVQAGRVRPSGQAHGVSVLHVEVSAFVRLFSFLVCSSAFLCDASWAMDEVYRNPDGEYQYIDKKQVPSSFWNMKQVALKGIKQADSAPNCGAISPPLA
jgi:hypothetical protein